MSDPAVDQELCSRHRPIASRRCLGCKASLCGACHHFEINGRPWCPGCAQAHLPNTAAGVGGAAVFIGKIATMLSLVMLIFLVVPTNLAKLGLSIGVTYVLMRVFFFRQSQVHGMRIDEIADGGGRKSWG